MSNPEKKPSNPTSPPEQTVLRRPAKGKMTLAQIKAYQQQRQEQSKQMAELEAQRKESQRKAEELAKEAEQKRKEKQKEEEQAKEIKRTATNLRRFNLKRSTNLPITNNIKHQPSNTTTTHTNTDKEWRSPICCVLGHVDTGKTKLLDSLRESNIQGGEAGGITQQIGATFFPHSFLASKYSLPSSYLPGLIIVDTPGHESFSNLRSRGSSLCDIAILVVDINHGLEMQTMESIQLIRTRRTPFVVALNKIDRIYEWQHLPNNSFADRLNLQSDQARSEFNLLFRKVVNQLEGQGLNCKLWYENTEPRKVVSIVPLSALTGEGSSDLVSLIFSFSSSFLSSRMLFSNQFECTVLEVKQTDGFGMTIDVVLKNGSIKEGDTIGVNGSDGPIITTVRSLLVPQPLKELRVKSQFMQVKQVKAAAGIKIVAHDLETVLAGSRLVLVNHMVDGGTEHALTELAADISMVGGRSVNSDHQSLNTDQSVINDVAGITVAASTLGSMEALLMYLNKEGVAVSGKALGRLRRRDILLASLAPVKSNRIILCFNLKIDNDLQLYADQCGVRIFMAEIIYHLLRDYKAYLNETQANNKKKNAALAVFPAEVQVIPNCVFNSRSPLVLGVEVKRGELRLGTQLCVRKSNEMHKLGSVTSIEDNRKGVERAKRGTKVAIKIEIGRGEAPRMFGRHVDYEDLIYANVTNESIAVVREYFMDELEEDGKELLSEMEGWISS